MRPHERISSTAKHLISLQIGEFFDWFGETIQRNSRAHFFLAEAHLDAGADGGAYDASAMFHRAFHGVLRHALHRHGAPARRHRARLQFQPRVHWHREMAISIAMASSVHSRCPAINHEQAGPRRCAKLVRQSRAIYVCHPHYEGFD